MEQRRNSGYNHPRQEGLEEKSNRFEWCGTDSSDSFGKGKQTVITDVDATGVGAYVHVPLGQSLLYLPSQMRAALIIPVRGREVSNLSICNASPHHAKMRATLISSEAQKSKPIFLDLVCVTSKLCYSHTISLSRLCFTMPSRVPF